MKKVIGFVFSIWVFSQTCVAQDAPVLVTAQWLKEHQKESKIVILQVNFMKLDYDAEHIPGAVYVWPAWLAPDSPEGSMNAPDLGKVKDVLQSMGISKDSHVVVCYVRGEVSPTARIFLTLEQLGLKGQVSLLNGGLDAWKKEGYPVTAEIPAVKKGNFIPKESPVLVDKQYVLNNLNSPNKIIVDARMKRFYDGESTGNPRDGHIAGAKNIPYTEMIDQNNFFKPNDQLQSYFTPVSETKDKELVAYCFIGQTASVVYMAGRILGYPMKVYDGSMQEWSRIKTLPMEITEKK